MIVCRFVYHCDARLHFISYHHIIRESLVSIYFAIILVFLKQFHSALY